MADAADATVDATAAEVKVGLHSGRNSGSIYMPFFNHLKTCLIFKLYNHSFFGVVAPVDFEEEAFSKPKCFCKLSTTMFSALLKVKTEKPTDGDEAFG